MFRRTFAVVLGVAAAVKLAASVFASAPSDDSRYRVVVNVSFTPAAAEMLKERQEGVVVFAAWQGDPVESKQRYAGDDGTIALGSEELPLSGRSVVVDGRKLDRQRLAWVKEPMLLIHAYAARRASPGNSLDCQSFEDSFATARQAPVTIACKLIGES